MGYKYLAINTEEVVQNMNFVISCGATPLAQANEALIFRTS